MLKRKIFFYLERSRVGYKVIYPVLYKLNLVFFHWPDREHVIHPGMENADKWFYVIRGGGGVDSSGLLAMYRQDVRKAEELSQNGYIPIIDWQNYQTLYSSDLPDRKGRNTWEYFFEQPSKYTLQEVYSSKNVVLGGWSLRKHSLAAKRRGAKTECCVCSVNEELQKRADDFWKDSLSGGKTLGVFLRGTDYVKLRPKEHSIQPSPETVIDKVKELDTIEHFDKIYLVTEDYGIYTKFRQAFDMRLVMSDYSFAKDYKDGYVSTAIKEDGYIVGARYLTRLLVLSKAEYLITSLANGSEFAMEQHTGPYRYKYIFDLGRY